MEETLRDNLKLHFAEEFSQISKKWEKKTYYELAEAAAQKKQFSQLPIDMLLYALAIRHEVQLETYIFDLLLFDGCKGYNQYAFEKVPSILEEIKDIELQQGQIYSLCKFISKKLWEKGHIAEGIHFANLLLEKNSTTTKKDLEYDFTWALRSTGRDDCKLSTAEVLQFIEFSEKLAYRSSDFTQALDIVKAKYECNCATEQLAIIIKKLFPRIKNEKYNLFQYSVGQLIHYYKWNSTSLGDYVNENYEEALVRLLRAIECSTMRDGDVQYIEHLLVALSSVYYDKKSSEKQNRTETVYRLFSDNEAFHNAFKINAVFIPELLGELFFRAFIRLDKCILEQIYFECISPYPKDDDSYAAFIGSLPFKFINCFVNLPCWSEETCEEYFSLCKWIDTVFPELKFKNHQAYGFFHDAVEGMRGLVSLQPLIDKLQQGVFWVNTESLPQYLQFDYIYPNGKSGDIMKYIFEEYGETTLTSGVIWHGKIGKEYIDLFGVFYSAIPLRISDDPKFTKIFEYHIPSIIASRLSELSLQKAVYFKSFREYQNLTLACSKEQTKRRTEIYAQVIRQGQASPKWKSEAQLYALVSSVYPDAMYQYKAQWLGAQSLDIFIPSISVGIEYQGMQHYKPIDHFGGEENFKRQQENDKKKRLLCEQNGITLIEWPYSEKVTKENLEKYLQLNYD